MLSNAYFLAKFRFDIAENEPAKNLQNFRKMHFSKDAFFENAFFENAFSKMHFSKFCKFFAGSFSAVSKRNFATKYALGSSWGDLQNWPLARLCTGPIGKLAIVQSCNRAIVQSCNPLVQFCNRAIVQSCRSEERSCRSFPPPESGTLI